MNDKVSTTGLHANTGWFVRTMERILHCACQQTVIRILNEGLAAEIACALRYRLHHYLAKGVHSQGVAKELLEHAVEEQSHADEIAERIIQLGGKPNFNPEKQLDPSDSEFTGGGYEAQHRNLQIKSLKRKAAALGFPIIETPAA